MLSVGDVEEVAHAALGRLLEFSPTLRGSSSPCSTIHALSASLRGLGRHLFVQGRLVARPDLRGIGKYDPDTVAAPGSVRILRESPEVE